MIRNPSKPAQIFLAVLVAVPVGAGLGWFAAVLAPKISASPIGQLMSVIRDVVSMIVTAVCLVWLATAFVGDLFLDLFLSFRRSDGGERKGQRNAVRPIHKDKA